MNLKLLSPIHIGSKEQISNSKFCVLGEKCYVVSESKLVKKLTEKDKDDYVDWIKEYLSGQERELPSVIRFIQNQSQPEDYAESICRYSCETKDQIGNTDLHTHIRNGFDEPFIPGTAIKGAIRTCVLIHLLEKLKDKFPDEYRKILENRVLDLSHKDPEDPEQRTREKSFYSASENEWINRKDVDKRTVNDVLQTFTIRDYKNLESSLTDMMRAIKVKDTQPLNKDSAEILKVKILTKRHNDWELKPFPIYIESIPECIRIDFQLNVDAKIFDPDRFKPKASDTCLEKCSELFLNEFPKNESDLLNICQSVTDKMVKKELEFLSSLSQEGLDELKKFYSCLQGKSPESTPKRDESSKSSLGGKNIDKLTKFKLNLPSGSDKPNQSETPDENKCEKPNLRIGWASGFLGTTILLDEDNLRKHIRKEDVSFKNYPDDVVFPKSRRVVVDGNTPIMSLGWCKIEG